MSDLSAALAAALQNDTTIGAEIGGVISGRNFELQDSILSATPYACIAVSDLPSRETPFLGGSNGLVSGQIEIRAMSSISEDKAKDIAEDVKTYLRPLSRLTWNGGVISFGITGWMQVSDTADDLSFWLEIITVDFKAAA